MIITTANEISIPVQDDIKAARGVVITRDHIEPLVNNQIFWTEYQEYLISNYSEYLKVQQTAEIEVARRSSRPLEDWQKIDMGILLS
jgi:hypothetical protein